MCQQAIEKCFKALITYNNDIVFPIHNLRRLAELSNVVQELDDVKIKKLDFLSQYYINSRYREDISVLSQRSTKEVSLEYLAFAKDIIKWLLQKIN